MTNNNPPQADALLAASIHEIKNRFGLMFSQLDQLLSALPLDQQLTHTADQIKSEAQFIGSELVRVLTSYKTLEDNESIVNQSQQFLLDFLEEKVARHDYTAKANALTIDFDCDDELDGFFDAGILNVIVDTAIYNAVKEGAKRILLSAELVDNALLIRIHDDGPGFPASMLGGSIEQGAVKSDNQSTGLGLYFAQRLISQHTEGDKEGYLKLSRSDRLGGACVALYLPQ